MSTARALPNSGLAADPQWYKDAIFYELRVRSFYDSGGDGIGDFPGLTSKLDYLQQLGVTTVWLLPFYPSPLRDDGYDISDYTNVHPDCGTLADFREFLREAHNRGLHVVTELVLNHTSDQHAWFQRARRARPGSVEREFYVWSDTPDKYKEARVIFNDFEPSNWSWDPLAKAYYWHRFYSHQPDLNYENPTVRREMFKVVDFWLKMGVDGLRLDAVPYIFEREGTTCENLPETHQFLRELRGYVDSHYANRMLLAEANQWPEDAVAYLAEGKECHMAFHFPLMPRMFMAVRMEDRFPLTDIWAQTPEIDPTCQWALFLRNHDELTLEMVTDEERDYMYRAFAQETRMRINLGIRRRLAPLLGNNRRTIELNNLLLLSLPGTPVIYYGDEIGMGDNVYLGDRDGVRTPMQWSGDRNAGFSSANPQRLILPVVIDYEYHYQTVNVEAQDHNRHSLLWWMRRVIALRRQFKAFGRGSIEFLNTENPRVLAFIRSFEDERILVVANLSRFVNYAEFDLSRFKGMVPIELFGRSAFPPIGELPYLLTLGPHVVFWFSMETARGARATADLPAYEAPQIRISGSLEKYLESESRADLERVLVNYMPRCRWFRSKARSIRSVHLTESFALTGPAEGACLALVNVEFSTGDAELYLLPLTVATDDRARDIRNRFPERLIANVTVSSRGASTDGILCDAIADPAVCAGLLELIARRRRIRGPSSDVVASESRAYRQVLSSSNSSLEPRPLKAEQSNTSIAYGDLLIMKLFRRLDAGINPDLEVGRFLTEKAGFLSTPPFAGSIELQTRRGEPRAVAILQGFVPNQGDAWEFTRRELERYFERAATRSDLSSIQMSTSLFDLLDVENPDEGVAHAIGAYLDAARLMGQRVAGLHLALMSDPNDPEFAPEPYTTLYQRSNYQSMRNLLGQVTRALEGQYRSLPESTQKIVQKLRDQQAAVGAFFESYRKQRVTVPRTRSHGDLHLGQMLYTGKDFVIIDFEGEPARPLADRRRKRSVLRDVAGMIRSFQYAGLTVMTELLHSARLGKSGFDAIEPWSRLWDTWASWAFLKAYIESAGGAPFIPKDRAELRTLLDAFQMEKAIYELGYELNNRPDWVQIPAQGILRLIEARTST